MLKGSTGFNPGNSHPPFGEVHHAQREQLTQAQPRVQRTARPLAKIPRQRVQQAFRLLHA
jgi:hypothetical protein